MWYSVLLQFEQIKSKRGPGWGCLGQLEGAWDKCNELNPWYFHYLEPFFLLLDDFRVDCVSIKPQMKALHFVMHHLPFSKKILVEKMLGIAYSWNVQTGSKYIYQIILRFKFKFKLYQFNETFNYNCWYKPIVSANIFPSMKQPKKLQVSIAFIFQYGIVILGVFQKKIMFISKMIFKI